MPAWLSSGASRRTNRLEKSASEGRPRSTTARAARSKRSNMALNSRSVSTVPDADGVAHHSPGSPYAEVRSRRTLVSRRSSSPRTAPPPARSFSRAGSPRAPAGCPQPRDGQALDRGALQLIPCVRRPVLDLSHGLLEPRPIGAPGSFLEIVLARRD